MRERQEHVTASKPAHHSASDEKFTPHDESYTIDECKILKELSGDGDNILGVPMLQAHLHEQNKNRREQQEHMAFEVEKAFNRRTPALFAQAGTGTGKSYAYIFAAAAREGRYVIATATNQLGEQLVGKDLPEAAETLKKIGVPFDYELLKGRSNYACKLKIDAAKRLERSFERMTGGETYRTDEIFFEGDEPAVEEPPASKKTFPQERDRAEMWNSIFEWESTTLTGDRSDAPPVTDEVWGEASATSAECVGRECPFYSSCYSETAKMKAKKAKVVVTNHALLAQEMKLALDSESGPSGMAVLLTPQTRGIIVDEGHDFVDTVSGAFSVDVDPVTIRENIKKLQRAVGRGAAAELFASTLEDTEQLGALLADVPVAERLLSLPDNVTNVLISLSHKLAGLYSEFAGQQPSGDSATITQMKKAVRVTMAAGQIHDSASNIIALLKTGEDDALWCEQVKKPQPKRGRRNADDGRFILKMSPIEVGGKIVEVFDGTTLVVTSATLTLNSNFSPSLKSFGYSDIPEVAAVDVGSPFNYAKQGMLYIPDSSFPAPVGKDRVEHTSAVLAEVKELVAAAGGRALLLFTTTRDAQECADVLTKAFPHLTILKHGDAPAGVLVKSFIEDETSVLCATMGMWQGVDAAGPTCSLVVVNKVAFPPPTDVLNSTRIATANREGRNGFAEVVLPSAAASLAQATGRLIRTHTDRGVVAILDPRLLTKSYGREILGSLPEFGLYSNGKTVKEALERLSATYGQTKPPEKKPAPKNPEHPPKNTPARTRASARTSAPKAAKTMKKRVITRGKPKKM